MLKVTGAALGRGSFHIRCGPVHCWLLLPSLCDAHGDLPQGRPLNTASHSLHAASLNVLIL